MQVELWSPLIHWEFPARHEANPKWLLYFMDDDWGYPYFYGNLHILGTVVTFLEPWNHAIFCSLPQHWPTKTGSLRRSFSRPYAPWFWYISINMCNKKIFQMEVNIPYMEHMACKIGICFVSKDSFLEAIPGAYWQWALKCWDLRHWYRSPKQNDIWWYMIGQSRINDIVFYPVWPPSICGVGSHKCVVKLSKGYGSFYWGHYKNHTKGKPKVDTLK